MSTEFDIVKDFPEFPVTVAVVSELNYPAKTRHFMCFAIRHSLNDEDKYLVDLVKGYTSTEEDFDRCYAAEICHTIWDYEIAWEDEDLLASLHADIEKGKTEEGERELCEADERLINAIMADIAAIKASATTEKE